MDKYYTILPDICPIYDDSSKKVQEQYLQTTNLQRSNSNSSIPNSVGEYIEDDFIINTEKEQSEIELRLLKEELSSLREGKLQNETIIAQNKVNYLELKAAFMNLKLKNSDLCEKKTRNWS